MSKSTTGTVLPRKSSHSSIHSTPSTATVQVPSLSENRTPAPTGRSNEVAGPPSTMRTGALNDGAAGRDNDDSLAGGMTVSGSSSVETGRDPSPIAMAAPHIATVAAMIPIMSPLPFRFGTGRGGQVGVGR